MIFHWMILKEKKNKKRKGEGQSFILNFKIEINIYSKNWFAFNLKSINTIFIIWIYKLKI